MSKLLAIEIGGTKLQLFVGDEHGSIHQRWRFPVDKARGGAGIREQIAAALPAILREHKISATGVGYGGPVDWQTGEICCSHQIEGWSDFPLASWLSQHTGTRVVVDNDANVAALGEAVAGAGQGSDPVFYVTLGSGVGGGLVLGKAIFHGAKPGESEIGHVRLDKAGTIVEQRCSGWAVDKRIRAAIKATPDCVLARLAGQQEGGEARHLSAAIVAHDAIASGILAEVADDLAFGLSHVVHLVHPEVVVLGGGLSLAGELLRLAVKSALKAYVMEAFAPGPRIALAQLKEDSVPVGALILAARLAGG